MNKVFEIRFRHGGVWRIFCVLAFLFALTTAEGRKFTSTEGKHIEGEIIAATEDSVVIKVGTKNFTVPVSRLVEADREYIEKWRVEEEQNRIPKLDVKVNPGVNNHRDKAGDFDDRAGSFDFSISIENRERGYDLEDASGKLVVLGRSVVDGDVYNVMQSVGMNFSIAEGKTEEWQGEEVRFEYDDNGTVQSGYKYYAYLFELKNSSGTVIYQKASLKKFDSKIAAGMTLSVGDYTGPSLQKNNRR